VDRVIYGENLDVVRGLEDGIAQLIYIDPPFNTGKAQRRQSIKTVRDADGDRTGFGQMRYRTERVGERAYEDAFDDYLGFLEPRLFEARRLLAEDGSLYFHIDAREVHYCKVLLDGIFGRECFLNEVIWAYDYGARTKRRWAPKHDNILVYVKDPRRYVFNADAIDRVPYMAPGLVGAAKAARGKLPTDTWWHTIVPTSGKEKTGYPTQKPLGLLRRIVRASSDPGRLVMDFFAGSGTTGAAAHELGRRFLLVDNNMEAIEVMRTRFAGWDVEWAEPGTGNREPGTGNGERGTGNGERGTGNRERRAGNGKRERAEERARGGGVHWR
jgi:site-specific DNA-methyltransferase (adenine-specific)